jgi:hypothetical protein
MARTISMFATTDQSRKRKLPLLLEVRYGGKGWSLRLRWRERSGDRIDMESLGQRLSESKLKAAASGRQKIPVGAAALPEETVRRHKERTLEKDSPWAVNDVLYGVLI